MLTINKGAKTYEPSVETIIGYKFKTRSCWRSRSPIPAMPTRAAPRSSTTSAGISGRQRAADRLGRLSVPRLCGPAGGRSDPHPRQPCQQGALFQFAQEIDLGEYLRLGRGEERCGGRTRPSVVSDAFEALIAALYLDGGMDVARSFILPFITEGKHAEADYKTRLQEIVQQNPEERLSYVVESESGPDHDKHFVVAVRFNSDAWPVAKAAAKRPLSSVPPKKRSSCWA